MNITSDSGLESNEVVINIHSTTGENLGISGILFLMSLVQQVDEGRNLDIIYDIHECKFIVYCDVLLTTLDETPDHEAWDKMHTIWEQMDMRGLDYLEVKIE